MMRSSTFGKLAAIALALSAQGAVAQTTEGEDAINGLVGLFGGASQNAFDSAGVSQSLYIGYGRTEAVEWTLVDPTGASRSGSGEEGTVLSIGRHTRGIEYQGGLASYAWGARRVELGADGDDLQFSSVGGFVTGGFGYGTNYGLGLSLIADADLGFGTVTYQSYEADVLPFTFGLGLEVSYDFDPLRVSIGAGRSLTSTGFWNRTQGEEVLDEFFSDTSRINASISFSF